VNRGRIEVVPTFARVIAVLAIVAVTGCSGGAVRWGDEEGGGGGDDGSSDDGSSNDGDSTTDGTDDDGGENPGGDDDVLIPFDECTARSETAHDIYQPADVIIAVDNTPSMFNEIQEVRENLGRFSQLVRDQGLDMRVVMISCRTQECLVHEECDSPPCWHTICVPPPLGAAGACESGADDTNLPDYLHVDQVMPSLKSLERIIWAYEEFRGNLRSNAVRHILVVSDDNDYWTPDQFEQELLGLDESNQGYRFHGIFSFMNKYDACEISQDEPCCTYAAPDGAGTVYRELVERTGGVAGDMCLQDFDPIFDELADAVIESVGLSCEWEIPAPPDGMALDPDLVNLMFLDEDGTRYPIGHVDSVADCASVANGWYYDDPEDPSRILVCSQTCDWIVDWEGSAAKILFGCETVEEPVY
jgi:hypothetical protein